MSFLDVCIVVSSLPCEIMGHVGATKYETSNFQRCCCQSGSSCANADRASHSLTHPEFKCLKRSWIRNRKNGPSGREEHGSACGRHIHKRGQGRTEFRVKLQWPKSRSRFGVFSQILTFPAELEAQTWCVLRASSSCLLRCLQKH